MSGIGTAVASVGDHGGICANSDFAACVLENMRLGEKFPELERRVGKWQTIKLEIF